jgi:hypothetical protein
MIYKNKINEINELTKDVKWRELLMRMIAITWNCEDIFSQITQLLTIIFIVKY